MFLIVLKHMVPDGFLGVTFFPFIFLKNEDLKKDQVFINHEKIHVRQQLQLLIFPFFIWYMIEFLIKWMIYKDKNIAYRNISFEREAYQNENDFEYLNKLSFWNFINYYK